MGSHTKDSGPWGGKEAAEWAVDVSTGTPGNQSRKDAPRDLAFQNKTVELGVYSQKITHLTENKIMQSCLHACGFRLI